MADQSFELDVLRDLLEEAGTIGQLAKNEKSFLAAYEAFRSEDRQAFMAVLKRLRPVPLCRLICEWIRIKECVFLCFELCGPPPLQPAKPDPRALAQAIARITANEKLVAQLVQIVEKRDRAAFQRFVKAQKLGPFCHLFCHWVCLVRYRLVCRWLCDLELTERPNLAAELRTAGGALRSLVGNRKAFDAAVAASQAGDAAKLSSVLGEVGLLPFCFWICEWFCSWRCVLVCLTLCREFPLKPIENELQEAFAFAKATAALAQKPADLERLSAAVGAEDTKTFAAIVGELKLQAYCIQLCHWICFLRCRRFCILICPDPFFNPIFTQVGNFDIYADIDPGTGRTNKSFFGQGGPDFGFFGCLELRGLCPKTSPTFPGVPMRYRFRYEFPPGNLASLTGGPGGGFLCPVSVGSRLISWPTEVAGKATAVLDPNTVQKVVVAGDGATPDPTLPQPAVGDPWFGPPPHVIVPDANGWIAVDQAMLDGGVEALLGFNTTVAPFSGGPTAPGVAAGTPVPVANQENGVAPHPAIIFEATRIGGPTSPPDFTNQLSNIHINNWDEVRLLDLLQFHPGGGCTPLSTDLDIEYTVDHELIRDWSIQLVTAAPVSFTPPPPTPPPPPGTARGGAGTYHRDISAWPPCSYAVLLTTQRRLTTGLVDDPSRFLPGGMVTFCIGPK